MILCFSEEICTFTSPLILITDIQFRKSIANELSHKISILHFSHNSKTHQNNRKSIKTVKTLILHFSPNPKTIIKMENHVFLSKH